MRRAVVVDVSELEPPQPLVAVLEALDKLAEGEYLHVLHRREPHLLLPHLERRGLTWRMRPGRRHAVELVIWPRDEPEPPC